MIGLGLGLGLGIRTAGGGVWTPSSLPSGIKVAWWRADLGTDTTTNGASITTWADQFGLQAAFTGATGSKPTLATSGIGGKPSLAFNGSQQLTCADSASLRFAPTSYHVVVVMKMTTENSFNTIISKTNGAFTAGWDHYIASGNIIKTSHNASLGSASPDAALDPTAGAFVYEARFDGSTLSWFVNGASPSPTGTAAPGGIGSDPDAMFIGRRIDAATFLTGQIAEIIMTNAVISGTDLTALKSYLQTRYAITMA